MTLQKIVFIGSVMLFLSSFSWGLPRGEREMEEVFKISSSSSPRSLSVPDLKEKARLFSTSSLLVERVRAADDLFEIFPKVRDWLCVGFGFLPYRNAEIVWQRVRTLVDPRPLPSFQTDLREHFVDPFKKIFKKKESWPTPPDFTIDEVTFTWHPLPDVVFCYRFDGEEVPNLLKVLPQDSPATVALWQAWYQGHLVAWLDQIAQSSIYGTGRRKAQSVVADILRSLPQDLPMREEVCKIFAVENLFISEVPLAAALRLDEGEFKTKALEGILARKDLPIMGGVEAITNLPKGNSSREKRLVEVLERPFQDFFISKSYPTDSKREIRWRIFAALVLPADSKDRREAMRRMVEEPRFSLLTRTVAAIVSGDPDLKDRMLQSLLSARRGDVNSFIYQILQSDSLEPHLDQLSQWWDVEDLPAPLF